MFELRVLDGLHQGAALPLFGEQWSIGAHEGADLLLTDPGVAEQHARLRLIDSMWSVQAEAGLLQGADGQVLAQITNLIPNVPFSIGAIRLCVTLADQPWPQAAPALGAAPPVVAEVSPALKLPSIAPTQQKRLLFIGAVVLVVIAGVKANDGVAYRYPFTWRPIK